MQQPGRGFGGLPGRGFGPGGPGRPGVGMQGRGGGRGRNVGGFGRGVHDLPPPEFQRRDGFSGLPGGPDQNRRTAAAAAVGPGPGGGPFVDHLAGRPDRGGPGPGRGGAGGLVGAGGPVPWRNMPIDFQGRGRPGPGPPRGPSGGLLPDPSSHVGGRGSDGAEIGPSSSGPMMDGIGMDRRDRMVGGRGDRAAMEIGRDASMGRRVVEGREGFERGGGGGGEFGDFSGVGQCRFHFVCLSPVSTLMERDNITTFALPHSSHHDSVISRRSMYGTLGRGFCYLPIESHLILYYRRSRIETPLSLSRPFPWTARVVKRFQ